MTNVREQLRKNVRRNESGKGKEKVTKMGRTNKVRKMENGRKQGRKQGRKNGRKTGKSRKAVRDIKSFFGCSVSSNVSQVHKRWFLNVCKLP